MTSEEGVFQSDPYGQSSAGVGSAGMGGAGMDEPSARPRAAEEMKRGWWRMLLAAGGSFATILGAVFLARRRSKRSGLMAAMPSPIAEASEQMMRGRGNGGGRHPLRAIIAVAVFALAGWGIRRTMAHPAT